jgi:hypothetical protein
MRNDKLSSCTKVLVERSKISRKLINYRERGNKPVDGGITQERGELSPDFIGFMDCFFHTFARMPNMMNGVYAHPREVEDPSVASIDFSRFNVVFVVLYLGPRIWHIAVGKLVIGCRAAAGG